MASSSAQPRLATKDDASATMISPSSAGQMALAVAKFEGTCKPAFSAFSACSMGEALGRFAEGLAIIHVGGYMNKAGAGLNKGGQTGVKPRRDGTSPLGPPKGGVTSASAVGVTARGLSGATLGIGKSHRLAWGYSGDLHRCAHAALSVKAFLAASRYGRGGTA